MDFNIASENLAFDIINVNWVFDVANENWALMLPMRIGFWTNKSPWVQTMGFDHGFEFH